MEAVLEDNGLKEFIDSDVPKPGSSDVALFDAWQKKTAKTRRILLESVKDHIVIHFLRHPHMTRPNPTLLDQPEHVSLDTLTPHDPSRTVEIIYTKHAYV